MKKIINGITRYKDPLYAKIRKNHIEWLHSIDASVYYGLPLADVDITDKRLNILIEMGLVEALNNNECFKGAMYRLTEKGENALKNT